jgi:hypothetical protein
MVLQLRPDQIGELAFYFAQPKCMDLSQPGTGKTPPVCVNMGERLRHGKRTVWIQPKSLMKKNRVEFLRWTNRDPSSCAIVDTPAQMTKAIANNAGVLIMGPDRFRRVWRDLPNDFKAIDVDEFHKAYKGAESKRTEAYFAAMRKMEQGVIMTGTLIDGRLDSAYPAIHVVEPRYYPLGYRQFLGQHAYLDEYDRPRAWYNHARLSQIIGRHSIRKLFKDIFGDQPVVHQTEWIDMAPKQRELYAKFEDEAYVELEKVVLDGSQPGPALIRARQIMEIPNQFPDLTDPEGKRTVDIVDGELPGKEQALEIHFEDARNRGMPLVVFSYMVKQQNQIAALAEKYGFRVGIINGKTSAPQRGVLDENFRAGVLDFLSVSPEVADVGFNWQFWGPQRVEVDHCIFASLNYMDSTYVQAYRRFIREKRSTPLRVTTLAYHDSVDGKLMKTVEWKSKEANKVDPTHEIVSFGNMEMDEADQSFW